MKEVYFYAIGGNLAFALGSLVFTHYSRKISSAWMNLFKACVAIFCFAIVVALTSGWHALGPSQVSLFFISGFLGLGVGDIFLLKGFTELGPGRSLMLFGFQPIILGILGYIFLNQDINSKQLIAIIFLILCLLTISYERFLNKGHWDNKGLTYISLGVIIDAIAIMITRSAFEVDPLATTWEGNFYRCVGAISFLLILNIFKPYGIIKNLKKEKIKAKGILFIGSFLGTFLSLGLYLKAIKTGHLASISAVAITGSIFSSIFECVYEKRLPSFFLILAFVFFLIGSKLLIF